MTMVGYPRQDAGLMYEAEIARQWEEQNRNALPDWMMAGRAEQSLRWATEELDKACDSVNEAAEHYKGTAEEDKIRSFLTQMEDILSGLKELQKEYKGRAM